MPAYDSYYRDFKRAAVNREKAIKRKRSWRASEKAMSITEVDRLTSKLLGEDKDNG